MPIISTEINYRLSGGGANASAVASLGGAKSSTAVPAALFDDVSSDESAAGDTEYRCIYVHNANASLSLQNAVLWITTNTTGNRISVGAGTSAINATEQTVADENTAPAGVTFSQPTSKGSGIALGTIPAGQHKAVWVRRAIAADSAASNDTYTMRVEGDTAA
jgi:hypothetical protein